MAREGVEAYELERHQSRERYTNAQLSNENTFTTYNSFCFEVSCRSDINRLLDMTWVLETQRAKQIRMSPSTM